MSQNPFGDPQLPGQNPNPQQNYGGYGNYSPPGGKQYYPPGSVKNYLIESILSLVFCGGLLAIPAIIFAAQVDGKLAQGDYQGALEASKNAKLWLTIAVSVTLVCGLGGACFYFAMIMLAIAGGAH
jgi:hypothetical protein